MEDESQDTETKDESGIKVVTPKEYESDLNLDEALDILLDQAIEKARADFYTFVQLMAPEILPEEFIDGRHIEIICKKLQEVEESVKKKIPKRLQIHLPPGSMKSRLGNLFLAWCLGRHPQWCFLCIASDSEFAVDNYGRPIKDLLDTLRYQAIFPGTVLKGDVKAAGRWDTTKKGRLVAKGVGQNIAGRRAHISICDDVITEQTKVSELASINHWYNPRGLRSRLLPFGAEIIINTRWFLNDLSDFMIKVDAKTSRPWDIVKVPALLTEEGRTLLRRDSDPPDAYAVGTSFWPEFWPTEVLLEKRATSPPSEWSALYMQSPISESGSIVKRADFKLWEEDKPPKCHYILVSMDTAFSTKETADFSAYSVWGAFNKKVVLFDNETEAILPCMILLDAKRGRWDFAELCKRAQEIDRERKPDFFVIEDKASGQSLIPELRKRGLPVMPYQPERDKIFRLQATTPYFQSGRIWVPKKKDEPMKDYVTDLIDEVVAFPKGTHDDLCDTVSQAILWMKDTLKIDNAGYKNEIYDEEEEKFRNQRVKGKTYWSALMS